MTEKKPPAMDVIEYCRRAVALADPDLYLLSLFTSPSVRAGVWARLAVYDELARVAVAAKDPTLRLIRLQWWRDQIAALATGVAAPAHPVLQAVQQTGVMIDDLPDLIDAIEDMLAAPHASRDQYVAHQTNVMQIVLSWISPDVTPEYSRAFAMIAWARAHPEDLSQILGLGPRIPLHFHGAPVRGPRACSNAARALHTLTHLYQKRARRGRGAHIPIPFKALRVWWGTIVSSWRRPGS